MLMCMSSSTCRPGWVLFVYFMYFLTLIGVVFPPPRGVRTAPRRAKRHVGMSSCTRGPRQRQRCPGRGALVRLLMACAAGSLDMCLVFLWNVSRMQGSNAFMAWKSTPCPPARLTSKEFQTDKHLNCFHRLTE